MERIFCFLGGAIFAGGAFLLVFNHLCTAQPVAPSEGDHWRSCVVEAVGNPDFKPGEIYTLIHECDYYAKHIAPSEGPLVQAGEQ